MNASSRVRRTVSRFMKLTGRWTWAGVALAIMLTGGLLGSFVRGRYEASFGHPEFGGMYASAPAVRDDGSDLMGGRTPGQYFQTVLDLLEDQFVDPIRDETALAHGAARFMLQSLRDPGVRFYSPEEWSRYLDSFEGKYVGLGADLAIRWQGDDEQIRLPLTIVSVYDGGPAAKAGLRAGDVIEDVDGKWVASRSLLNELAIAGEKRSRGEITDEQYQNEFERLREKSLQAIPIDKAIELLEKPSDSPLKITVLRSGKPIKAEVLLAAGNFEPIERIGDSIRIRSFGRDVDSKLARMLPKSGQVTLDLSDSPGGSFQVMERCLEQLLPSGEYGKIQTKKGKQASSLTIEAGVSRPLSITVIVNRGTAREAEMFAVALRDRAAARIVGGPTARLGILCDRYTLLDGSGYTLTRGSFFDLSGNSLYVPSPDKGEGS